MLADSDIERLADAIATRMARFRVPVLTAQEAAAYVGKGSEKAFREWRKRWKVGMCADGRYSRRELDAGLSREARNKHERKTA